MLYGRATALRCVSSAQVLPLEYQSFALLRPSYMHRVLRADQACRSDSDPFSVRTGVVPVLCTGELRDRIYSSLMAYRNKQRRMGQSYSTRHLQSSLTTYVIIMPLQPPPSWTSSLGPQESPVSPTAQMKRRRKSFGADSPEVVTIGLYGFLMAYFLLTRALDHIRPDWEAKLAAVRAAVARRANRRIVMRQVGDRLIPVGITSGRIHALQPEEAQEAGETTSNERGSRRSRRRNQNSDLNQYLGQMGLAGPDLEEVRFIMQCAVGVVTHLITSLWSWKLCGYHYWIMRSNSGNNERRKRRSRGKEARAVGQRKAQKLALLLQRLLLHLPQRNPRYRPLPRLHQHSCHPETRILVAREPAQDIGRRLPCPGFPFRLGVITRLADDHHRLWGCLELPCGAQSVRPVRSPHHHQKRGAAAASICRRAHRQQR